MRPDLSVSQSRNISNRGLEIGRRRRVESDVFEPIAKVKGVPFERSDAIWDGNRGKTTTRIKCAFSYGGDAVGDEDVGQAPASPERACADGSDAVWNHNLDQTSTVKEGAVCYRCNAWWN